MKAFIRWLSLLGGEDQFQLVHDQNVLVEYVHVASDCESQTSGRWLH